MHLRLHKNATTTPRIRAEIQVSKEPMRVLAQRFGVSVCTIARWKKRASVHDASHTPHRLQTTLTPAQESIVLVLRKSLGLSLDDLLAVVREFIHPTISRAALHRMLKRHGVSAREALSVDRPRTKPFKAYEPGFVHIDVKYLPQMADETTRRYLFVAIDRATRWVFVRVYASKSATNARRFLKELHKAAAFRIRTILTDNGKEFTDRFITRGERTPTGRHQFDQLCEELGIEHRLTRPKHPQTNGMVERFNGRIADILRTHHFHCGEELEATILRYVWLYNHQLPQKALGHVSPIQAMKQWQRSHPELFNRRVTNQPGHDNYINERRQSGKRILEFQGIQFMLADMASELILCESLLWQLGARIDAGEQDFGVEASVLKQRASDAAMRITTDAVQLFGGYGYCNDYRVERLMRDAKITQIWEGTNQIHRQLIGRSFLKK
ncbi:IS481 family transposase [Burkholderia multivorans]|uniref:IS481 family transposase n=2 Tax=Burkholderia multivorans TaxID=87883 RepID=UPI003BA9E1B9